MLLADTMAIFFVILGLYLAFPGLWLVARALFPSLVERATGRCERKPVVSFLVGLPVAGAAVLATAILANLPGGILKMGSALFFCVFLFYAHVGVAGLATHVGNRLPSPIDRERPWRATLRGGVALELAWLLPILGWFVILPVSMVLGAGAATLALFSRTPRPAVVDPAPEEARKPEPAGIAG